MVMVPFERKVFVYQKSDGYAWTAIDRAVIVRDESKTTGQSAVVSKSPEWKCQIDRPVLSVKPTLGDYVLTELIPNATKKLLIEAAARGRGFEVRTVKDRTGVVSRTPYAGCMEVTS